MVTTIKTATADMTAMVVIVSRGRGHVGIGVGVRECGICVSPYSVSSMSRWAICIPEIDPSRVSFFAILRANMLGVDMATILFLGNTVSFGRKV